MCGVSARVYECEYNTMRVFLATTSIYNILSPDVIQCSSVAHLNVHSYAHFHKKCISVDQLHVGTCIYMYMYM